MAKKATQLSEEAKQLLTTISPLRKIMGVEHSVDKVSRTLHQVATLIRVPVVGAMHITCADESERECMDAFNKAFVQNLLPRLSQSPSAFRLASLGGHYEWGAVRIAEDHFATPRAKQSQKLMVVKINGHVGVIGDRGEEEFGSMMRYDMPSKSCGALHALLGGVRLPAVNQLREVFSTEGLDRLGALKNSRRVPARFRVLSAALVSARLQARLAILDIQDYAPKSPTIYLVVPCVTVNRKGRDTEIVCGAYIADHRGENRVEEYVGLGDDPSKYKIETSKTKITVTDPNIEKPRTLRNHRELVLEELEARWATKHRNKAPNLKAFSDPSRFARRDPRRVLKELINVLKESNPASAAALLFAMGVGAIHHSQTVHHLACEGGGEDEAHMILDETLEKIDDLDSERARALIEYLVGRYT